MGREGTAAAFAAVTAVGSFSNSGSRIGAKLKVYLFRVIFVAPGDYVLSHFHTPEDQPVCVHILGYVEI